jgi:hypothetical protein
MAREDVGMAVGTEMGMVASGDWNGLLTLIQG